MGSEQPSNDQMSQDILDADEPLGTAALLQLSSTDTSASAQSQSSLSSRTDSSSGLGPLAAAARVSGVLEPTPGGQLPSVTSVHELDRPGAALITAFLREHTCYDVMPEHSKVVVLSTAAPVSLALHALVAQHMTSVALWDRFEDRFVSVVHATDLFSVLMRLSKESGPLPLHALLDQQDLGGWYRHYRQRPSVPGAADRTLPSSSLLFDTMVPTSSLYDVVRYIRTSGSQCVPVTSTTSGNLVALLTLPQILRFVVARVCVLWGCYASLLSATRPLEPHSLPFLPYLTLTDSAQSRPGYVP